MPKATAEARAFATGASPPGLRRPVASRRRRGGAARRVDGDADRATHPPRDPDDVPDRPAAAHPPGSADGRLRAPSALPRGHPRRRARVDAWGREEAQKRAVESVSPGDVLIMEARGEPGAGTIGDIRRPGARAAAPGSSPTVASATPWASPSWNIPTYYRAANASSLWTSRRPARPRRSHHLRGRAGQCRATSSSATPRAWVVLLPTRRRGDRSRGHEAEEGEAFALERVKAGESFRGLYPLSDERRPEFETWVPSEPRTGAQRAALVEGDSSSVRGAITRSSPRSPTRAGWTSSRSPG